MSKPWKGNILLYNTARAKLTPLDRIRRKPYEHGVLAKIRHNVCMIPYGVFRILWRSHIPMYDFFTFQPLEACMIDMTVQYLTCVAAEIPCTEL